MSNILLDKSPDNIFLSYQRFRENGNYKKALKCLLSLLSEFPNDIYFLEEMIDFSMNLNDPKSARKWLKKIITIRSSWIDHMILAKIEAEAGNINMAKKYFNKAETLQAIQPLIKTKAKPKELLRGLDDFIRHKELVLHHTAEKKKDKISEPLKIREQKAPDRSEIKNTVQNTAIAHLPRIPEYTLPVKFEAGGDDVFSSSLSLEISTFKEFQMLVDYTHLSIQKGYDDLVCVNALNNIEKFWYQIETVKKVLKRFHGRVLLCDEVGLGKTIEAGLLIKEYLTRGMVKNVLILTPSTLVSQWKEEMRSKFDIEFITTGDTEFSRGPESFWKQRFIIASINTAKRNSNIQKVTGQFYDLVVVDEAHHLRNRNTLAWALANRIKKKFIFLLTATPLQNNLVELFNLITLLKPGQFKTEKLFRHEYVEKGSLKKPANKDRLRELLRDVMIRNTRSVIDIKLPKRFASTLRLESSKPEKEIYARLMSRIKTGEIKKSTANLLLREAGSCPFALKNTLTNIDSKGDFADILEMLGQLDNTAKGNAIIDLLMKNPGEKKIIFTQFIKSMEYIGDILSRHEIPYVTFSGGMSSKDKDNSVTRFKNEVSVLVSTEVGGEGRNLQFCNTLINFDLPWNPMRIEQRIGRLHRIGQTRDVFIFNLCLKDTIEDYIIDILDNKINMFEMVIGEIEPILGYLNEETDFEDIIMDIWLKASSEENLKNSFIQFGEEIVRAKEKYLESKNFDNEIFGEDYEI